MDPKPKYVGIDQSYSGFAITAFAEDGTYYTEVYEGQGKGIDRLRDIALFLGGFLADRAVNVVGAAMEGYSYGAQMAHMAGELGATVKHELAVWGYDKPDYKYPLIVPPSVLKKYVTGKGTGVQKNQILLNIYKKWGVEFNDDNAADSYALARMAAGMADLEYEKEIIKKTLDPKFREKPLT